MVKREEAAVKVSSSDVLSQIPGPRTAEWPDGEPFADLLRHGSMSVEIFAPRGQDHQTPHEKDELYLIKSGNAAFFLREQAYSVSAGDVLFVPAEAPHHFEKISDDFVTWVVFWGPVGGEGPD